MYAANESGPSGLPSVLPSGVNDENRQSPATRYALAGLQAGVLGALVMLACLMTGALWNGRSAWVVPNLFASTFFGSGAYRNQLLRTSWIGVALIVAVYGGLGAIWGCIWRGERRRWLGLYGAIAGLGVYFVFYGFLWRHVNPLVTLYAPDRQLQLGHVLWGMVLARSPLYARRIADSTTAPAVHDDIAGQEVRSGEVIR
jgi:hypothetical protein